MTRQAVHLVETGKARPSMPTLRYLADRLGISLTALLPPAEPHADFRIGELEHLCQRHEYVLAVVRAREILDSAGSSRLLAFAHHFLGQALYYLSRPDEALTHLAEARAVFQFLDSPAWVAETMDWEAMALHVKEDVRAYSVAEEALRRYRDLEPRRPETEARMLEHLGTILYGRREYSSSRRFYESALRMGGDVRELARIGRIYHGLAMCDHGLGDLRRAADLLSRAVDFHQAEHRLSPAPARTLLPRAENDLGLVLAYLGDFDRAEELFESALAHFREAGAERVTSHVLLSFSELRQRQGRLDDAVALVEEAIQLADRHDETLALASAHRQLGDLHHLRGHRSEADRAFERAVQLCDEAGLVERRDQVRTAWAAILAERHRAPVGGEQGS